MKLANIEWYEISSFKRNLEILKSPAVNVSVACYKIRGRYRFELNLYFKPKTKRTFGLEQIVDPETVEQLRSQNASFVTAYGIFDIRTGESCGNICVGDGKNFITITDIRNGDDYTIVVEYQIIFEDLIQTFKRRKINYPSLLTLIK